MSQTKISAIYLIIGIFTFISIFVSIVHRSYNNLVEPVRKTQAGEAIKPMDTGLDIDTIKLIEKREEFTASPSGGP